MLVTIQSRGNIILIKDTCARGNIVLIIYNGGEIDRLKGNGFFLSKECYNRFHSNDSLYHWVVIGER